MLIPIRRKKILEVFLKEPFKEVHLREIARLSGVSLTNVDNSMRLFVKEDLFKRRKVSNMVFFKPNLENEALLKIFEYLEFEKKINFYDQNKKIARLLQKYTQDVVRLSNKQIQLVILFGSVARGEWTKNSDLDILVVVSGKGSEVTTALNKAKTDVGPLLEISPVSTTTEKFIEGFRKKTEFYDELWKDRVVLYNEFLFWQLVKEGATYMPKDIEITLRKCFHPKGGSPNLLKVPISIERVRQHMDKAHSNLRAMKIMFDSNLFDWTISCGYYAMYHAVLASLFKIGVRATAHYCAIAAFKKFYVERGKVGAEYVSYIKKAKQLEQKYAETLEKAQEERVIEQYGVEILTSNDAEWIIEEAKDFVLKIEEVLAE